MITLAEAEEMVVALRDLYPIPRHRPGGPSIYAVRSAWKDGLLSKPEALRLAQLLADTLEEEEAQ